MPPAEARTASEPFDSFNDDLITAVVDRVERLKTRGTAERHQRWLHDRGGHLMTLLPMHFLFDVEVVRDLAAAGAALLDIQTKLLRHLVARHGRDAVLDLFAVAEPMRRFVNWHELQDPSHTVARFDILQTEHGFSFCEFNVDSCVAGAEIFEFMTDYFDDLGVDLPAHTDARSPLDDLAAFLAEIAGQRDAWRIVILDWSVGGGSAGKGYLSFDWMRTYVEGRVCPIPVHLVDERSYDERWLDGDEGRHTIVFRGFMMDEMDDGGALLDRILAAGTTVVNTYESEIRMNKSWFALFHDPDLRRALDVQECALIDEYVPYTVGLDRQNVADFVRNKEGFLFKQKQSFGGGGILIGDEATVEEVERTLNHRDPDRWTAQELLKVPTAELPYDDAIGTCTNNVVFGLYQYGHRSNGVLVRASVASRIVNVTAGRARLAWALPVSVEQRRQLLAACGAGG